MCQLSCGSNFTLFISEEHKLVAFGENNCKQCEPPSELLGIGSKVRKLCCGDYHSLLLLDNGTAFGFGSNRFGQITIPNVQQYGKVIYNFTLC